MRVKIKLQRCGFIRRIEDGVDDDDVDVTFTVVIAMNYLIHLVAAAIAVIIVLFADEVVPGKYLRSYLEPDVLVDTMSMSLAVSLLTNQLPLMNAPGISPTTSRAVSYASRVAMLPRAQFAFFLLRAEPHECGLAKRLIRIVPHVLDLGYRGCPLALLEDAP